jgi:hypothetical protein
LERFGPFRYCTKDDAKLAELVPLTNKFSKQSRVKIFCKERTRSTPLDPTHVLGRFGPLRYCTKFDAKMADLVPLLHKFTKQSRVEIFHNECTRSTPLDPKHMFWGVSDRFITARKSMQNWPNWCHYRTSSPKQSRVGIFSQRTHPIYSIGPKTNVLGRFGPFRYCTKVDAKLAELVPLTQKFAK